MTRTRSFLALALLALTLPIVLAACGGGVPGNAVARVEDESVKKSEFDHWMQVAALSQSQTPGAATSVPDAPAFTRCIAAKQKAAPKPAKGQKAPAAADLKKQCQTEYNTLRDQVLQFLVSARWIQGEAENQKVSISDAEVNKQFEATKKQSFPKPADFDRFLKQSGMTQQDILYRVRLDALSNKLREKIIKGKDQATPAQIQAYYDKNRKQFAQPETRDLRIILTKDRAKAEEALAAVREDGFTAAAKKFSIDPQTKAQGGKLLGVAQGQQDQELDQAAFKAKPGKVQGPVKGQFGFYVFQVDKVTPPRQQTLQQATPTIRQTLASQNQQKALADFVKSFRQRWKEQTNCREGFVIPDCKQGKAPKTQPNDPAAAGAAATQGTQTAPQQGAPQGTSPAPTTQP